MPRYGLIEDGTEWVSPRHRGFRLQCCDCGLVHVWRFRIVDVPGGRPVIEFQLRRDNRATAAVRRGPLPFTPKPAE